MKGRLMIVRLRLARMTSDTDFIVIASEAKQSRRELYHPDCFVAALLAMTEGNSLFSPCFLCEKLDKHMPIG